MDQVEREKRGIHQKTSHRQKTERHKQGNQRESSLLMIRVANVREDIFVQKRKIRHRFYFSLHFSSLFQCQNQTLLLDGIPTPFNMLRKWTNGKVTFSRSRSQKFALSKRDKAKSSSFFLKSLPTQGANCRKYHFQIQQTKKCYQQPKYVFGNLLKSRF